MQAENNSYENSGSGSINVSIPYSSGEKCKPPVLQDDSLRAADVSIPYSSGEKCKFGWSSTTPKILRAVSIPYSSGEKCKMGDELTYYEQVVPSFNPLFIRGKMQEQTVADHRRRG